MTKLPYIADAVEEWHVRISVKQLSINPKSLLPSSSLPTTMATGSSKDNLHIVMFPWLAFGHIIPYLELSKRMARKGHRISFLSTPRNIDRLPKLPPDLIALINFVKIELPVVENLPENAEATSDLPYDNIQYLKKAYDLLREPVTGLLEYLAPDWILYDFAPYWAGLEARKLGIKTAMFSIFAAVSLAFVGPTWASKGGDYRKTPEDYTIAPKWIPFQSNIGFPYFAIRRVFDNFEENVSGVSDVYRFGAGQEGADIIAVKSSYELEPEWLKLLEELHEKPILPVGQLPPNPSDYSATEQSEAWQWIKQWLDAQKEDSVVYAAFGTEAKPSQDELTHIAFGLESSGLPFFWVLRTQLGSSDRDLVKLPDGFEERVKGRGIVWTTWAPQLRILAHDSVGGFLTHSGWSSVVEALTFGRPLVLLAFLADQGLLVRFLEAKKIGYPIPRSKSDGSFTSESVAESLRLVVLEEEGKCYREKAKEMKQVYVNQELQEGYIDHFLDYLKANRPAGERRAGVAPSFLNLR